jgi:heme b synthase
MTNDQGQRAKDTPFLPRLIAWEVTRSCPLACKHCRAAARNRPYEGELSTDEGRRLLENIARLARPTIILTGGEPMLRDDVYDLAAHADGLGLPVVMAPCGRMVDRKAVERMKQSGIRCISISLDGATPESHDAFRGVDGAFDMACRAAEAARRGGLAFQINTTVTRANRDDLPAIRDLAVRLGAEVFNPFLLVPTGRGKDLAGQELSAAEYERTLAWLADQDRDGPIRIRVTCAPHYSRLQMQRAKRAGEAIEPSPPFSRGCMGGKTFAFISHTGKVQICGFLEEEAGDLREVDLDFARIWRDSALFAAVRNVDGYGGRCGACEYRLVCGGCRARAYAFTGDVLAEEPFCVHQPRRA